MKAISDDDMAKINGSDLQDLADTGVPCRLDGDVRAHMHHKFCLMDDRVIMNGSFNWTVQAVKKNQENLMIVENPPLVKQYDAEFDKLWGEFAEFELKSSGKVAEHYLKALDIWQHRDDPEYEDKLKQKER